MVAVRNEAHRLIHAQFFNDPVSCSIIFLLII